MQAPEGQTPPVDQAAAPPAQPRREDLPAPEPHREWQAERDTYGQERLKGGYDTLNTVMRNESGKIVEMSSHRPESRVAKWFKGFARNILGIGIGATHPASGMDNLRVAAGNYVEGAKRTDPIMKNIMQREAVNTLTSSAGEMLKSAGETALGAAATGGAVQLLVDSGRVFLGREGGTGLMRRSLESRGFLSGLEHNTVWKMVGGRHIDILRQWGHAIRNGDMNPKDISAGLIKKLALSARHAQEILRELRVKMSPAELDAVARNREKNYFADIDEANIVANRLVAEGLNPYERAQLEDDAPKLLDRKRAMHTAKMMLTRAGFSAVKLGGISFVSSLVKGALNAYNFSVTGLLKKGVDYSATGATEVAKGATALTHQVGEGLSTAPGRFAQAWNEFQTWKNAAYPNGVFNFQ